MGVKGIGGGIGKTGKTDCPAGRGWQRLSWRLGSDESPAKPHLAKIHSRRHLITSFRSPHRFPPTTNLTCSSTRQLNQKILQPQSWARFTDRSLAPVRNLPLPHRSPCRIDRGTDGFLSQARSSRRPPRFEPPTLPFHDQLETDPEPEYRSRPRRRRRPPRAAPTSASSTPAASSTSLSPTESARYDFLHVDTGTSAQ